MKESLLLFYMFVDGRSVNQWAISKNVARNQETEFIEEISGLTEKGEIQETAQTDSITQSIAMDQYIFSKPFQSLFQQRKRSS